MAFNQIETPGLPSGSEQDQLEQMYRYLVRLADDLNVQMEAIGGNELTDAERAVMQQILTKSAEDAGVPEDQVQKELYKMESLKSLIIKTASFVQTSLQEYRTSLLRQTVAEGQFGKYVRNTGLDVVVNPEGVTQNYSFQEIVQGLREYEINAKNYIKTGLLRYENSLPVYGVAIGKDIVTFSNAGVETYNDGNKVAELTADALGFYQNGALCAKYTANKLSFYAGGNEIMYIQSGKIYAAQGLEIGSGKTITVGNWTYNSSGTKYKVNSTDWFCIGTEDPYNQNKVWRIVPSSSGMKFYTEKYIESAKRTAIATLDLLYEGEFYEEPLVGGQYMPSFDCNVLQGKYIVPPTNNSGYVGSETRKFDRAYINSVVYSNLSQQSSRDVKHGIRELKECGKQLDGLRPVTFIYNDDAEERRRPGLIYEEAAEVLPEICSSIGEYKAINYVELIPYLLKEIQDLRKRVDALEKGGK